MENDSIKNKQTKKKQGKRNARAINKKSKSLDRQNTKPRGKDEAHTER